MDIYGEKYSKLEMSIIFVPLSSKTTEKIVYSFNSYIIYKTYSFDFVHFMLISKCTYEVICL